VEQALGEAHFKTLIHHFPTPSMTITAFEARRGAQPGDREMLPTSWPGSLAQLGFAGKIAVYQFWWARPCGMPESSIRKGCARYKILRDHPDFLVLLAVFSWLL
jgi:hypothetical protein